MTNNEQSTLDQPKAVKISRGFPARRPAVFGAWTSAEKVKRWFCPQHYSIPEATIEPHIGGKFEICMRAPDGLQHWTRGSFVDFVANECLVIDMHVFTAEGKLLFTAHTEVDFSDTPGGTLVEIVQTYTFADETMARPMIAGAQVGWSQSLDKLAEEIARGDDTGPAKRSVVHASFHLERTYKASPARIYKALSDEAEKRKWFGGSHEKWEPIECHMDFRVGGTERAKGRWESGLVTTFDAVYHDIVPEERIVYTYEMHLNDKKISVSLATMQITRISDTETKLAITEQGAFLDSYDDAGSRERGTAWLMDKLGETL